MTHSNNDIVAQFYTALSAGDFEAVSSLLSDDLLWHQPGKGVLSGTFKGKEAVFAHLAKMSQLSEGTFGITVDYSSENRDLVAVAVHFSLSVAGQSMAMNGIDLFRLTDGKIVEVWLFSEYIDQEEHFWNALAN